MDGEGTAGEGTTGEGHGRALGGLTLRSRLKGSTKNDWYASSALMTRMTPASSSA